MKATTVSIFTVTNGAVDGFQPAWRGGRGDELDRCPFSFDENASPSITAEAAENDDEGRLTMSYREIDGGFHGQNLEGVDFGGDQMAGVDFAYANLRMADCRHTNFDGAKFRFADLTFADFDFAQLSAADLSYADLCKASFRGAQLRFANLTGADLEHANFLEADLRGVILSEADCRNTNFSGTLFDATTTLPFSKDDAVAAGMIESPVLLDGPNGIQSGVQSRGQAGRS